MDRVAPSLWPWDHRKYGGLLDPVHKSHCSYFVGHFACPKQFHYVRNDADGQLREAGMRASLGTAGHAVVAMVLDGTWTGHRDRGAIARWIARAVPDADPEDVMDTAAAADGLIADLPRWVLRVIGVEQGFIAPFGDYWLAGHIDLIYEPVAAPGTIAMCDWKFGAMKPHPIALEHGFEGGLYSAALHTGVFEAPMGRDRVQLERDLIAEARSRLDPRFAEPTYGAFPSQIHQVHAADYVPYKRAGSKLLERPEDLALHGYREATQHKYKAGDQRGGAWMPIHLRPDVLSRFHSRLKVIVGTVRLGRFIDSPDEKCGRCHYRSQCLNAGYAAGSTAEDYAALAQLEKAERVHERKA